MTRPTYAGIGRSKKAHGKHDLRLEMTAHISKDWPQIAQQKRSRGLQRAADQNICYRRAAFQALMHIPKFCNWIAEHNTKIQCGYPALEKCLLCVFKRDAEKYWKNHKPYIENEHDRNFRNINREILSDGEFRPWDFANVMTMADCNEFLEWLIEHGFPYHSKRAFGDENEWNYWKGELPALFKIRTDVRWICQNILRSGELCLAENIVEEVVGEDGNDEVGLRVQCGNFERKQDESDKEYQIRSSRIRSLDELIYETLNEDTAVAAAPTCSTCGVKEAKCPKILNIISSSEALIIKLSYFEMSSKFGYRPLQLNFEYGLWLDLSRFQPPDHRRRRKGFRYRLSSVLFHGGEHNKTGHWLGIHTSSNGIWAVSDCIVKKATVRDMLTTEIDEEAALRLWNVDSATFAHWRRITPVSLVYVRV